MSAFTIFMDVHIEKYPTEALSLLSYMSYIRDLGKEDHFVFNRYDQSFRRKRAQNPLPWDDVNIQSLTKAKNASALAKKASSELKTKPCWRFNVGNCRATAESCKFGHICQTCKWNHPQYLCRITRKVKKEVSSQQAI